jgi:hypothetical protein
MAKATEQSFGCLKYGCIVAIVLASLIGGGLYLYVRYSIKNAVETYTQASPVEISDLPIAEEVRGDARRQGEVVVASLREALSSSIQLPETKEIISEAKEINSEEARRKDKEFTLTPLQLEELLRVSLPSLFNGKGFQIRGEGETLSVDFSLSVRTLSSLWESFSQFALGAEDRYFNGRIAVRGGISGGRVDLEVKELVLAGSTLPEMGRTSATSSIKEFLKALLSGQVEAGKGLAFDRIQDAKVVNGNLVITLK